MYFELRSQVSDSLVRERLIAQLTSFFGVVALLLAAIGLYGVLSYLTMRRAKEIGIRIALGSTRSRVVRMVVGEAAVLVSIGLIVGTLLALASGRLAASMLYGLHPNDPLALAVAVVIMSAIAAVASGLPALRASRVDPMSALREEESGWEGAPAPRSGHYTLIQIHTCGERRASMRCWIPRDSAGEDFWALGPSWKRRLAGRCQRSWHWHSSWPPGFPRLHGNLPAASAESHAAWHAASDSDGVAATSRHRQRPVQAHR